MITFPQYPNPNQEYVATNAVTYVWTGDRWDSITAIREGAQYVREGGSAPSFRFTNPGDDILDGGDVNGNV